MKNPSTASCTAACRSPPGPSSPFSGPPSECMCCCTCCLFRNLNTLDANLPVAVRVLVFICASLRVEEAICDSVAPFKGYICGTRLVLAASPCPCGHVIGVGGPGAVTGVVNWWDGVATWWKQDTGDDPLETKRKKEAERRERGAPPPLGAPRPIFYRPSEYIFLQMLAI